MTRAYSKLTAKSQTTVPKPVREALRLTPGDAIAYEIEGSKVTIRKETVADTAYLRSVQGMMSEWDSPEDAAAYDDL